MAWHKLQHAHVVVLTGVNKYLVVHHFKAFIVSQMQIIIAKHEIKLNTSQ